MVTLHILREGETQPVATWLSWGSLSALGESQESHPVPSATRTQSHLLPEVPWRSFGLSLARECQRHPMVTCVNDWTTGTSSRMPSHPKSSSPKRQGNGEEILNQSYQRPEIGALSDVLRLSLCQCQTNLGINHSKPCPNWKTIPTWGQPVHKLTHGYSSQMLNMYGIFNYIYPKNGPNVGKHSIHGANVGIREASPQFQGPARL